MKTKTQKHTPEPYEVHMFDNFNRFEVQAVNIGDDGEGVLCDLSTEFVKPQEAEANAYLFAAAPDQNAVLSKIVERLDRWCQFGISAGPKGKDADFEELKDEAHAALAKAEAK